MVKFTKEDEILLTLTNENILHFGILDTKEIFKNTNIFSELRKYDSKTQKVYDSLFKQAREVIEKKYENIDVIEYKRPIFGPPGGIRTLSHPKFEVQWIYKNKSYRLFDPVNNKEYTYMDVRFINGLFDYYENPDQVTFSIQMKVNDCILHSLTSTVPYISEENFQIWKAKSETLAKKIEEVLKDSLVILTIRIHYSNAYITKRLFELYHHYTRNFTQRVSESFSHSEESNVLSHNEILSLREMLNSDGLPSKFAAYDFQFKNPTHLILLINFLLTKEHYDLTASSNGGKGYEASLVEMFDITRK
jgi:hypothetical protein